jgi:hypothetical protein
MLIADYVAIGALIACMLVLCAGARAERTRNARRWRQCDTGFRTALAAAE